MRKNSHFVSNIGLLQLEAFLHTRQNYGDRSDIRTHLMWGKRKELQVSCLLGFWVNKRPRWSPNIFCLLSHTHALKRNQPRIIVFYRWCFQPRCLFLNVHSDPWGWFVEFDFLCCNWGKNHHKNILCFQNWGLPLTSQCFSVPKVWRTPDTSNPNHQSSVAGENVWVNADVDDRSHQLIWDDMGFVSHDSTGFHDVSSIPSG